ncbi:hypothetical protein [Thermomonospora cellulosilytica]|uniref:Uncharacterized protein n=1 Tax=Thermomonospora cellulosilytica TaxID=1411118 RepID=A0A7W3R702_9ACTN|nr:hypothetical protein [Thermomonospora cellulosilytica]MBA9001964.1 hypothetical protein [Thermomonospora cellulosilytica]
MSTVPAPASAPPVSSRRRNVLPWLLVAGYAAQVAVRLWLARARVWPAAEPDETGYLVAARWLAGGPAADMSGNTFYQGGYSLLLVPAYWLTDDPVNVYTLAIAINAVIGAAAFPLGYLALRRLGMRRRPALPAAWAAALLPAATFFGSYALTDAVLPVLVLAWLLALDRCTRDERPGAPVLASLSAAYAHTMHSRGTVLLAVHLLTLAFLLWRRLMPWQVSRRAAPDRIAGTRPDARERSGLLPRWRAGVGPVLAGVLVTGAGCAAGAMLNARVRSALYPRGTRDLTANIVERVTTLEGQAWALSGTAGQIWYLVVGTWGLAGIGLAATVAVVVRRRVEPETRLMALVLLVTTCGIAYAASAALPDEHRVGNFAYGRYLSCVALAYTLAGLAALARRGTVWLGAGAAGTVVTTGAWVRGYAGERLRTHLYIGFDFPETSFLAADRTAFHLGRASLVALGLLAGFLVLRRLGALAVAAGLVAVNLAAMTFIVGLDQRRARPAPVLPGPAAGGVALDRSLFWVVPVRLTYAVWWTRMTWISTRTERPAPGVCTVVVPLPAGTSVQDSWPGRPPGWRPYVGHAWTTPWVAWQDPACPATGG